MRAVVVDALITVKSAIAQWIVIQVTYSNQGVHMSQSYPVIFPTVVMINLFSLNLGTFRRQE